MKPIPEAKILAPAHVCVSVFGTMDIWKV